RCVPVALAIPPHHRALVGHPLSRIEAVVIPASVIAECDQVLRQSRVELGARVAVASDDVHGRWFHRPNAVDLDRAVRALAELELEAAEAVRKRRAELSLRGRDLVWRRRAQDEISSVGARLFPKSSCDVFILRHARSGMLRESRGSGGTEFYDKRGRWRCQTAPHWSPAIGAEPRRYRCTCRVNDNPRLYGG